MDLPWWSIIVALVLVFLVDLYRRSRVYTFFADRGIPYSKALPVLGSAWKAVLQIVPFATTVKEFYDQYPDAKYSGIFDLFTPIVMIRDLDLLKEVTVKHFDHFPDHRNFSENVDPLFSRNLFALSGDRWREVRNLLSPAFTSSKMKAMFVLMRECAQQYGDYFANLPEDQRVLELKDAFTRYTNDVIATCAFGVNVDSMRDRENKFYVLGRESTTFGRWQTVKFFLARSAPRLVKLLGIPLIRKEIGDFFLDLVSDTIKTRDEKGIVRPDVIQLMMETRGKLERDLTIEDMTAQAFVFFFGGFESSSTLMCFAAHEVGANAEIQKRLQEEIDQVLEKCNGEVTYEAINSMKYLDAIINEALRMYPVIVAVDRVCVKSYELPPALPGLKPHVVREGELLWIPIFGVQYDPKYYHEPEKFNPERFYDDPKQLLNSGAFLSFGMGPRMCIGNRFALLEAKVLLFHIFAKCTFKRCAKTCVPVKLNRKGFSMTAQDGFWFEVQPRDNARPELLTATSSNGVAC